MSLTSPPATRPVPPLASQEVLGIPLALTDYTRTLDWIEAAVAARQRAYVCVAAVHTVMESQEDPELREAVLASDFTVPDGQPLVWAMNLLGHNLSSRVYGPDLMERACERAARTGQRFFLYGGRESALRTLRDELPRRYPGLRIAGVRPGPFRELTPAEAESIAAELNAAEPDVIWVGLGVPLQEKWMASMRSAPRGARARRRRRRLRLPRRPQAPGARQPPAARARVGLPARAGAAPPVAALSPLQPALRDRVRAPICAPSAGSRVEQATCSVGPSSFLLRAAPSC